MSLANFKAKITKTLKGSKAEGDRAVRAVIDGIAETLAGGKPLRLPGLGTFRVAQTKARKGRNLRTGQAITIPAAKAVRFKASPTLKRAVNGKAKKAAAKAKGRR